MKVIEICPKAYRKLNDRLLLCRMIESPRIDPQLKNIKVYNSKFQNEYERLMYEWLNPPIPISITIHKISGEYCYVPKRDTKK